MVSNNTKYVLTDPPFPIQKNNMKWRPACNAAGTGIFLYYLCFLALSEKLVIMNDKK